jgi:cation diffusion facilitator CzcD-associated flavoprotein CzcO
MGIDVAIIGGGLAGLVAARLLQQQGIAGGHPIPGRRLWVGGTWQKHILLADCKAGSSKPGYLAGAIEAAGRTVAEVTSGARPRRS